ncbi:MAG TPA: Uma2 family endonuclease [Rhizobiaceae bacterium]|nr:Uma2 family endonuclease [Rhizobiaceae bacterium]
MSIKPSIRKATYADLQALPENMVGEIIHGVLEAQPRPAPRHSAATLRLSSKLGDPFDFGDGGAGGWIFLVEPELHLGPDIVVPDLAGWRRETLPQLPKTAWIETRPDWVCEVLSPSTARLDRGAKREIYAREGVGHLWLLDPVERYLEGFALSAGFWLLMATISDSDAVSAPPFEAISFPPSNLFPYDTTDETGN